MSYQPPKPDIVDAANSSTATLLANATFTGTTVDCTLSAISSITVTVFSDVPSATNGFMLEWSSDGSNWDEKQSDTNNASLISTISDRVRARYYRVVYVNGASNQTVMRMQTLQSATNTSGTVRDINTTVASTDEAQLVRSVLTGKNVTGNGAYLDVAVDSYGSIPVAFGPSTSDAFQRARVAPPQTLFNVSFEYDTQPLIMQVLNVGAGTGVKTTNVSSMTLATGGNTSGDGSTLQSKQYLRYEPGKSLAITQTGVIGAAKANVRSQIGYYDANNGMFFDQNNGIGVTVRTHTSGSPVDTTVLQASWNIDKMDGTGPSGITLDFSKEQIFYIDLQWLGAGRIRFGFIVGGLLFYCHQVLNANVLSLPYTNTACLPVRWEIHNTGTASGTTTMTAGCGAVIAEGGNDKPLALPFAISNGTTEIAVTTRRAVLSIRPKTTFNSITNRGLIRPLLLNVWPEANSCIWELVLNGTLGGVPSFASVDANSLVEFDVAGTTVTGGTVVARGYASSGSGAGFSGAATGVGDLLGIIPITLDIAGTGQDVLSVVCTSLNATSNISALLGWSEQR